MAYKRKTVDCYAIEGNCGYGWDIECNCEDRADEKNSSADYDEDDYDYDDDNQDWGPVMGGM